LVGPKAIQRADDVLKVHLRARVPEA
jgi:hypothetical protein